MRLRIALFVIALASPLHAALFDWPTENRALLEGRPQDFFMYVNRNFEGEETKPWEGGSFGFVRGPQRQDGDVIYTTLHEGIDIAPVRRDASGNPLDEIRASADGIVVHTSREAGASNYGRYVVIEHKIEGCRFYTLYAHLSEITTQPGQRVSQGDKIGRMGFSGAGINRDRAHLHFEIAVMLSENFETWHRQHFAGSPNKHGLYNGLNLVGIDPTPICSSPQKIPPSGWVTISAAASHFTKSQSRTPPRSRSFANIPGWFPTESQRLPQHGRLRSRNMDFPLRLGPPSNPPRSRK